MQEYYSLLNEINNCKKCRLYKTRNKIVIGSGSINATIMIIGEAPGKTEDQTGLPFTGRSGRLLEEIFSICKIDKEKDIFLTNIIKCRPPQNRIPSKDKIDACLPWLDCQIDIIKPSLIILLGTTAARTIINKSIKLKDIREKLFYYKNIPVYATYHPSAALRNKKVKNILIKDLNNYLNKKL